MRKCHVFDGAISFVFSFARLFCPHSGAKYACALRYFAAAQYAQLSPYCRLAIRAHVRPMSLSLHTGSCSPYVAIAPYGLMFALCRCRSIRAHVRPMSLSLHTGSGAGYVLTFVARIRQRTRAEFNSLRSSIFGVYSFDRADRTSDIGSKSGS